MESPDFDENLSLSPQEIAHLLPPELQRRLSLVWGEPSSVGCVALSSLHDNNIGILEEYGIISTSTHRDQPGTSDEADDYDQVSLLEDADDPSDDDDFLLEIVEWTDLGLEVSEACSQLWPVDNQ